jgi:nucleoside 2-deoxyribosyltransferase
MISDKCILTGRNVTMRHSGSDFLYYTLHISENEVEIFLCNSCCDRLNLDLPNHIISGLIANGKWPERSIIVSKDCSKQNLPRDAEKIVVPEFFDAISYPKNASEKLNNLFMNLIQMQKVDGEVLNIDFNDEVYWVKGYFQSVEECYFYIDALTKLDFIQLFPDKHRTFVCKLRITLNGLIKATELISEGIKSVNCFLAMAFEESTNPSREAIKRALKITGFKWIVIDEEHLASDKTIPDGIIAGIKNSHFCIADFSLHRHGVYFESGYALGLGKQVIYLCQESEFEKAHFDIKQLQHIIYKSPEDLEKKLISKIEAWIK